MTHSATRQDPHTTAPATPGGRRERRLRATRVAEATTPNIRQTWRSLRFWLALLGVALLITLITFALNGQRAGIRTALDPDSAAPQGSAALVSVLRDHGVTVVVAATAAEARESAGPDATLMISDPHAYTDSAGGITSVADGYARTVVVSPTFPQLQDLGGDASNAGYTDDARIVRGECSLTGDATGITVGALLWPGSGEGCFGDEESGFGIVVAPNGTVFLGDGTPLQNGSIASSDNAAAALTLLGSTPTLVWYLPELEAIAADGDANLLARSTPSWVVPGTVLALVTALAAMFWRGRRFGALVSERLPVTVPSDETMRGRGRLYQRIGASEQALNALRVGARTRINRALGLPPTSTAEATAAAVAARLGRDPEPLRAALATGRVGGERDLLHYAGVLEEAEFALAQALDPRSPTDPTSTTATASAKEKP